MEIYLDLFHISVQTVAAPIIETFDYQYARTTQSCLQMRKENVCKCTASPANTCMGMCVPTRRHETNTEKYCTIALLQVKYSIGNL